MLAQTSRRDFLRIGIGAAVIGGSSADAQYVRIVRGVVSCLKTGFGISGLRVSNGREIVLTDDEGRYRLPVKEHDIPFIIKPVGYKVPTNSLHIPSLHASIGEYFFDIALEPEEEPEKFDVFLFADPQPSDEQEVTYLADLVGRAGQNSGPDFAICLGDLVGDNPAIFSSYDHTMSQLGIPVWNLPGNHDFDFSSNDPLMIRQTGPKNYGPRTRAFEYGSATFILLDNVAYVPVTERGYGYIGEIGVDNLAFISSLLETTANDRLIILCMHIPLISGEDYTDLSCRTHDYQQLLSLLSGRRCISFSGHMHTYEHHLIPCADGTFHEHKILNAMCGSWWSGPFDELGQPVAQSCDGTPKGWYVLSIEGLESKVRFESARTDSCMRIMVAKQNGSFCDVVERIRVSELHDARVYVNVFDGGPNTLVKWRIAGYEYGWMSLTDTVDPSTQALFNKADQSFKPWAKPVVSTHLWKADFPATLSAGEYKIEVHVVQQDGQYRKAEIDVEIIGS